MSEETLNCRTGVLVTNHVPYLSEVMFGSDAINVSAEKREKEFFAQLRHEHNLPDDYDFNDDPEEVFDQYELQRIHDGCDCDEILVGFKFNEETQQYEEDPEAEYSIVFGELYAQIIKSKYITYCAQCSPCFPYQGDLGTPGNLPTYALPEEMWGEYKPEWMKIKEVKNTYNETGFLYNHGASIGVSMF